MAYSAKHLNGNMLCAVDTETTGTDHTKHDIWQICVLPLDATLKPSKEYLPFYVEMRVKRPENIDPKAIKLNKVEFYKKQQRALDPWTCADLFDEWFVKLNLPLYKKIIPLAQNWPFDRSFIFEWLGAETFYDLFSPLYRDLMESAIFLMDLYAHRSQKVEITQYNLAYLANKMGIKNEKAHDALQDCITTAEAYRRLLNWAM